MTKSQPRSSHPDVYPLLSRAELLGLVPVGDLPDVGSLDERLVDLAKATAAVGLAAAAAQRFLADPDDASRNGFVAAAADAVEQSPLPSLEWPVLRRVLGDGLLARLTGVSEVSLRRYATGQRTTPDDVASRLHWAFLVVADLHGSYTDIGVRRWFARPRTQLDGGSPTDVVAPGLDPDGEPARRVRSLAHALTDLGAA